MAQLAVGLEKEGRGRDSTFEGCLETGFPAMVGVMQEMSIYRRAEGVGSSWGRSNQVLKGEY